MYILHFRKWKLLKTRQKKRYACMWRSSCENKAFLPKTYDILKSRNFQCERLGTFHLSQLSTIISSRERYVKTFPKNAFSCVTIYYFRSNFAKKNSKLFSKVPKWRHRNFGSELYGLGMFLKRYIIVLTLRMQVLVKNLHQKLVLLRVKKHIKIFS